MGVTTTQVRRTLAACWSWGRGIHREAAIDSARNVLAVIGAGTVLGDFSTMRLWMALPCGLLAIGIWYADYMRHF